MSSMLPRTCRQHRRSHLGSKTGKVNVTGSGFLRTHTSSLTLPHSELRGGSIDCDEVAATRCSEGLLCPCVRDAVSTASSHCSLCPLTVPVLAEASAHFAPIRPLTAHGFLPPPCWRVQLVESVRRSRRYDTGLECLFFFVCFFMRRSDRQKRHVLTRLCRR